MFKFNFELDDLQEADHSGAPFNQKADSTSKTATTQWKCFIEHSLSDIITQLPPEISYSPLTIVQSQGERAEMTISRRDLFDARFQLIASSSSDNPSGADSTSRTDLEYVEAPSDLVPGVYEGGLKTWECSVDIAAVLHKLLARSMPKSQSLLEIGCGTAIPSLCVLHRMFTLPPVRGRHIAIHLQDYNDLVFRLVTLPNVILAWYMSPASESFRTSYEAEIVSNTTLASSEEIEPSPAAEDDTEDVDPLPPVDPTQPGDLPLAPALLTAFQKSLADYGIELRFFSGSWETFDLHASATGSDNSKYDIVITSETIYRTDSLPSLLDLMWRACTGKSANEGEPLEKVAESKLKIEDESKEESNGDMDYLCLVAAKQVYFGVGGGVTEFVQAVESGVPTKQARHKGKVESIWTLDEGVKRSVMRVTWL